VTASVTAGVTTGVKPTDDARGEFTIKRVVEKREPRELACCSRVIRESLLKSRAIYSIDF
jgi:hypothetical protein